MTVREWATALDKRETPPTNIENVNAAKDGIIMVYRLAGGHIHIGGDSLPAYATSAISSVWCPSDSAGVVWATWEIKTPIPHETFDIYAQGDIYCRGVVFSGADAADYKEPTAEGPIAYSCSSCGQPMNVEGEKVCPPKEYSPEEYPGGACGECMARGGA